MGESRVQVPLGLSQYRRRASAGRGRGSVGQRSLPAVVHRGIVVLGSLPAGYHRGIAAADRGRGTAVAADRRNLAASQGTVAAVLRSLVESWGTVAGWELESQPPTGLKPQWRVDKWKNA